MEQKDKTQLLFENKDYIISRINSGAKKTDLGREFGVDRKTIERSYKRWIEKPDYTPYEVSGWESQKEKSPVLPLPMHPYWLGVLASDGNLSTRNYEGKFVTSTYYSLTLSSRDKDVVDKLRDYINVGKVLSYQYGKYKPTYIYTLKINSDEYNYFSSLGITPNKSLTLKILDSDLLMSYDFWRGVVDGDGHFGIRDRGNKGYDYRLGVTTGSKEFVEQMREVFPTLFGDFKYSIDNRGNNTYRVYLSKKPSFIKALELLYKNAPPELRMERRYEKAMGLLFKFI